MIPMQLGTGTEIEVLKIAVTAGLAGGVVYDIFALIRRTVRKSAVTFICDLIFTLLYALWFFTVSLSLTDYLRGFLLMGMLFGTFVWHNTVGRLMLPLLTYVICGAAGKMLTLIVVPLHKLCKQITLKTVGTAINFVKSKKIPQST